MFDIRYTNDIVLLIWIGIAALLSKSVTKKKVTVLGQEEERYSFLFAVIVFFPIFWFVTTVFMRGDMYAYQGGYNSDTMSVSEVFQNWNSIDKGPGYSLLVAFSKSIGIADFNKFRVLMALLQSLPLVLIYRRYSDDYVFSIFLFIANMIYDGWMMNGMRQFLAACIIFAAFPFMIKKKRVIFALLVVLLAMTVHNSAILMIPVILLVQFKPWGKLSIILMIGFAIALYIYIYNSNWMSEETLQQATGSNPLRIVVSAIPVGIAFVGRKQIAAANNHIVNICINMSMVTVVMYAVASLTSGIMAGRLPGYTLIFNFILFPYLLNKVFNETISKNLRLGITLFYVAYFILDLYLI
ncbi:EpsG family protein [Ruminococcaceae bacterium P7]|nr:EpsG family protein [Ruminococcaceae bacterium P7]